MGNNYISYTYDEGQTTTKNSTTYGFDYAQRLVLIDDTVGSSRFSYDGAGNRLKADREKGTANEQTTYYIYDTAGNLLAEADETKSITRYYIHWAGLLAMIDADTGNTYCYHYNATGHTAALSDSSGSLVNKYTYTPFGTIPNGGKVEGVAQPFTYVGQYGVMTENNGLYYMRARYYDAEVGRFISEDPIGFAGGINLYAYAGNNPIIFVDPNGEDWISTGLAVAGVLAVRVNPIANAIITFGSIGYGTYQLATDQITPQQFAVSTTLTVLSAASGGLLSGENVKLAGQVLSTQFGVGATLWEGATTIHAGRNNSLQTSPSPYKSPSVSTTISRKP